MNDGQLKLKFFETLTKEKLIEALDPKSSTRSKAMREIADSFKEFSRVHNTSKAKRSSIKNRSNYD
jgi:hypothetical protein